MKIKSTVNYIRISALMFIRYDLKTDYVMSEYLIYKKQISTYLARVNLIAR